MSFPRYPEYKDSGVEWLGDVPRHWDVWKVSHAFAQIGSGTTPKTDNREYYDGGDIPWVNTGDLNDGELDECEKRITALAVVDHSSLKTYPAGSLLIAMYGATIGRLAILNFAATVNQACCVFAGKSEIASKFMFYWFLGLRQQIISLATGGGQPNISQDILRSLRVASPSFPEQSQIAAFLDRETAKIDALVAEQRRLMALLKEKRQAVISHAVTRGLNPQAPMKPSGIEWLGDVPEHWEVKRIKHLLSVLTDYTSNGSFASLAENVNYLAQGYSRLVRLTDLREDLTNDGLFVDEAAHRYLAKSELFGGEVLIANVGAYAGYACLMPYDHGKATLGPNMYLINFNKRILTNEYGLLCLMSLGVQEQLKLASTSTAQPKLNKENVKVCVTVIPPTLTEQAAILSYVSARSKEFGDLIKEAQRAIDLLQERRTALISAAVTGQIDIRSVSEVS